MKEPKTLLDFVIAMKLRQRVRYGNVTQGFEQGFVNAIECEDGSGTSWNIRLNTDNGPKELYFKES